MPFLTGIIYVAAIGYTMYRKEMDFDKACHISDKMMYDVKRKMKEEQKAI